MKEMEKFRRLVHRAPNYKRSILAILILGLIFGWLNYLAIYKDLGLFTPQRPLSIGLIVYIVPAIIYGFLSSFLLRKFKKRRAYLLALCNEIALFVGGMLLLAVGREHLFNFIWWWMGLIYSFNALSFLGVFGSRGKIKSIFYPLIYPALVFPSLFSIQGIYIVSKQALLLRSSLLLGAGVLLLLLIHFIDFLFNFSLSQSERISLLDLVSSFITKRSMSLDSLGTEANVLLQGLKIKDKESNNERATIAIPWLHPGPIQSLGGGFLSTAIIDKLEEGFFWHIPSSHNYDPTNLDFLDQLQDKIRVKGEKKQEMTKMLTAHGSGSSFQRITSGGKEQAIAQDEWLIYGQRIDDVFLIALDFPNQDDYDPAIFKGIKDRLGKKLIFIDTHNHAHTKYNVMQFSSSRAEAIETAVEQLVAQLEQESTHPFQTGCQLGEEMMGLTFQVADESNLWLTFNRNGLSQELQKDLKDLLDNYEFDNVLILTTDAHTSVKLPEGYFSRDKIKAIIDRCKQVFPSYCEYIEDKLNGIRILGGNYRSVESSIGILAHLFILLLLFIYLTSLLLI